MTAKEAYAILHPDTTAASIWEIKMDVSNEAAMKAVEDACIVACEALAKQIPKNCKRIGATQLKCICGAVIRLHRYCPYCGQKLDWSE